MIKLSTKKEVEKQIKKQKNLIRIYINRQINLSNELISSITIFTEDIFNDFVKYLAHIKKNLELFDSLNNILDELKNAKNKTIRGEIINKYNELYAPSILKMLNTKLQVVEFIRKNKSEESVILNDEKSAIKANNEDLQENTLIISEISNKVVLPYTIEELSKFLEEKPDYEDFNTVIDKEFTIPLKHYKYTAISRFKEGMELALKRSGLSRLKALSLSLELLANYNLHPAIITACKNIDELDIYLSCLEDDELDEFNLFNIKFEMLPQVSKNKAVAQNS